MNLPLAIVELHYEHDVVLVRQRARTIAGLLGFVLIDQTRIGTAVSEIARNAFRYAGGGRVEFLLDETARPRRFVVRVVDRGPGIEDLPAVLEGRFRSRTGMGSGLVGARRLVDSFEVDSRAGEGTTVVLAKTVPAGAPPATAELAARISKELASGTPEDPFEEIQRQNQELLAAMNELRRRQDELEALNRELEDTNRGMVAVFAELDENASRLRRAGELRAAFLSNMTHEFRTPLNAILAISRLLLDRADGELTPEQERQAGFIRRAAEDLSEMVNDLLDLARIEAGRTEVKPAECRVGNLLSSLRGMFRPMLGNPALDLVFEEPEGIPPLWTDEGKLSQILRNLVSNALKFTERGEVRVSVNPGEDGGRVVFSVADTGIGIPPEHLDRIFEEYVQVDSPLQRRATGTGLGLPLSRKLAELLGGSLTVESSVGRGSTFHATIPLVHPLAQEGERSAGPARGGS